jgi:hypothetical protein
MFHLQQVFRHDAGKALKYYITNTLKKPNRISIRQFFCPSRTAQQLPRDIALPIPQPEGLLGHHEGIASR